MASHYRYQWTSPRTGIEFCLYIAPASSSTKLNWGVGCDDLDDDAIVGFDEITHEYDKYPIGWHSVMTGKVTFAGARLPADLLSWIMNPHSSFSGFGLDPALSPLNGRVTLSTIFRLTAKLPGGHASHNLQCTWVVDSANRVVPDSDGTISVGLIDAVSASLKNVTLDQMRDCDWAWVKANFGSVVTRRGCIEWFYTAYGSNTAFYVGQVCPGDNGQNQDASTLWAVLWSNIQTQWCKYAQTIYNLITRTDHPVTGVSGATKATIDISDGLALVVDGLYRQTYNSTPEPGASLTAGEVYCIPFVTNDDFSTASRTTSMHDELARSYPTLYDLLSDVVKGAYAHGCTWHYTLGGADYATVMCDRPLSQGIGNATPDVNVDDIAYDAEPTFADRIMGAAVTSWEFYVDDDYQTHEAKAGFARNDESYTFPVVFNPVPTATTYETSGSGTEQWRRLDMVDFSGINGKTAYQYKPRLLGLYYLDNPNYGAGLALDAFTQNVLIRCHSWRPLHNADESAPTPPTGAPYTLGVTVGQLASRACAVADQQEWGLVYQVAQKASETFADYSSATLKFKAPLDAVSRVNPSLVSANNLLAFVPRLARVEADIRIRPEYQYLTAIPIATTWYPTKVTTNLLGTEEVMEIECWGKP